MRKRLAMLLLSLTLLVVLIPASAASATSCDIGDPGVDDVQCVVHGTPGAGQFCAKLRLC